MNGYINDWEESVIQQLLSCLHPSGYLIQTSAVQQRHQLMEVSLRGVEYLLNLPEGLLP